MATAKKGKSGAAKKGAAKKGAGAKKSAAGRGGSISRGGAKKASASKKSSGGAAKKRTPNPAFMKPMTPSSQLAAVVGSSPMPRTEITKKLWEYIKRKGLQDAKERRMINADENLRPIFKKDRVSMFDMTKLVNKHLSDAGG